MKSPRVAVASGVGLALAAYVLWAWGSVTTIQTPSLWLLFAVWAVGMLNLMIVLLGAVNVATPQVRQKAWPIGFGALLTLVGMVLASSPVATDFRGTFLSCMVFAAGTSLVRHMFFGNDTQPWRPKPVTDKPEATA